MVDCKYCNEKVKEIPCDWQRSTFKIIGNELFVELKEGCYHYEELTSDIKIKFCPMCGRKLENKNILK